MEFHNNCGWILVSKARILQESNLEKSETKIGEIDVQNI